MAAISVAGQQHGMVCLDEDGRVVRPALLWNDTRSADAAADLIEEAGGGAAGRRFWAEATGSVPVASFTLTKLRWLATARAGAGSPGGGGLPAARLADLAAGRRTGAGRAAYRPG